MSGWVQPSHWKLFHKVESFGQILEKVGLLYRLGKEKHELITGGLEQIIEFIKKSE